MLGRRPDGYHLLDSLAVFAEAADELHAEPSEALTLDVSGPFASGLDGGNLVLLAAQALFRTTGCTRGARLHLDKRLPVASGIGGGSADAAAALRLLDRMWGLGLPPAELAGIALELGADVPACLMGEPVRMGGVGEILATAPILPRCGLLLVNPGVPVSTAEVFRARDGGFSEPAILPARWAGAAAMAADLRRLGNDLEAPARLLCPAVDAVLAWIAVQDGCLLARMSGSGATCFGLFTDPAEAEAVARRVSPGWWSWGGAVA